VLDLVDFTDFSLPQQGGRHSGKSMTETTMNLRGLKCPLPALRVKKMLSSLKSGDLIVAECTDPLAAIDIPNLLQQTGDALESKTGADGVLTFRIRKK
jgi:tRNA 2-thiouridine synthesizing protein A